MNANQIKEMLSNEISSLRKGTASVARVNAISNAVEKIIKTVKTEIILREKLGLEMDDSFLGDK